MFKNKKKYDIDIQTADKMLQNVFAACEQEPNHIPLAKIALETRQDFHSDASFIVATILLILFTLILPVFFPPSKIFLSVDSANGRPLTFENHNLTEDTFSITLQGASIDLSKTYMEGDSGDIITPSYYDRSTNTLEFPFKGEEYNIYIYDAYGRCLHLLLSPHEQGIIH